MTFEHPRIALVTGATSGIGEAVARKFISAGYGVVGNGRNAEKLAFLEKEWGPAFLGVSGDATEEGLPERLFAAAKTHFGREADVVIVNAGRGLGGSVTTSDLRQFEEVVRINLCGALALMQKAGVRMVEKQREDYPARAADIVVIGSVAGRNNSPFSAAYGASKFAVHALAESLRREIGPKGVRVTLIEPGIVISGFQSVAGYSDTMVQGFEDRFGPLLDGEDVANAVHFAVSQAPHVHLCEIMLRPTRQDYP